MAAHQGCYRSGQPFLLGYVASPWDGGEAMSGPVLILGATSSIARAAASVFAAEGYPLYLAGRDMEELSRLASDMEIRHDIAVKFGFFDAEDYESHDKFLRDVIRQIGELEGVIVAFGYLGDQSAAIRDFKEGEAII